MNGRSTFSFFQLRSTSPLTSCSLCCSPGGGTRFRSRRIDLPSIVSSGDGAAPRGPAQGRHSGLCTGRTAKASGDGACSTGCARSRNCRIATAARLSVAALYSVHEAAWTQHLDTRGCSLNNRVVTWIHRVAGPHTQGCTRGGVGAAPAAVAARAGCGHLERGAQQRCHPTMEPRGDADAALAPVEEQQRAYRIRAMRTHRAHTMRTPCTHRAHTVHTPCAQHACAPVEEQQPLWTSPPQLGGLAQRVALAAHVARLTREVQRQHGEQRVCGGMQPRLELLTQPRLGKRVGAASWQVDPAGARLIDVRWQREGHLVRVRVRVRVRLGVVW